MRIVHLSDFHFSNNTKTDFIEHCCKPLISDLKAFHENKAIDLIVFSGDLIDKGGLSFNKNIELAFVTFEKEVIQLIMESLNLAKDRFVFVPGNHDIDRSADSSRIEKGMFGSLISTDEANHYINEDSLEGAQRIKKFKEFEQSYYSGTDHLVSNFSSSFSFMIDGVKVGVSSINSAWRCWDSDTDKDRIIIGERQVSNAIKQIEDSKIKIAVIHHPFDWLAPFEKKQIEKMIQKSYDLVFFGHVHEGESLFKTNMFGSLFVSIAPSNWSGNIRSDNMNFLNGYSIIDYVQDEVIVHARRYSYNKDKFIPDNDRGDDFGNSYFQLPTESDAKLIDKKNEICETIRIDKLSQVDEHLLTYSTSTQAPKKIDDIFVLPPLTFSKVEEEEDNESFDIEKICMLQENIIFIGDKESGKTILLDKLLIDFTNRIDKYNLIPVIINLEESSTSKFETDISQFLNIRINEIDELLKKQKIVLLIDNITPTKNKILKLKKLEQFLQKYPNVRVIATCTSTINYEVPFELRQFSIISKFKVIKINPFKSKQIRVLIRNWFSTDQQINDNDFLDGLIQVFSKLNISRTPLAVSMFLNIIEFQPNYNPLNNAVMLENYIELLFEKYDFQNFYSSKFDFRNKQRLLGEIAYQMHQQSLVNYKMKRIDVINFIDSYLNSRKFYFKADEILEDIEKSGVFIEENDNGVFYLRFRFNCFFKYFLMKNMNFNSDFRDFVLSEEHYLLFEDEIDYYTGLNRDEEEILLLVTSRMNEKYEKLLLTKPELLDFDKAFISDDYLVSNLSEEFLNNVLHEEDIPTEIIDEINDAKLEVSYIREGGITSKQTELSPLQEIEVCLKIAARVLKNTEETNNGTLKLTAYKSIIKCSAILITLIKIIIKEFYTEEQGKNNPLDYLVKFFPSAQQVMSFDLVASLKLEIVMKEDINEKIYSNPNAFSEIEKFISVFIYSDLKGFDHLKYIKDFLNSTKKKYIKDNILVKLINYYNFRSGRLENEYLNLIGDIRVMESSGKHNNAFISNTKKDIIMKKYKSIKEKKKRSSDESQFSD